MPNTDPHFNPARRKARKRAIDVLYEADIRGKGPLAVLTERKRAAAKDSAAPQISEYTEQVIAGIVEHFPRIDELLSSYAEGWTLERMPIIDRSICRIGVYELLWEPDVDDAVVINEAVELAKSLSTDDSPRFINGILARIAQFATR